MSNTSENWTREHDLALVYIALAYGNDQSLGEREQAMIVDALKKWRVSFPEEVIKELVVEAVAVYMEDTEGIEVIRSIHALKDVLSLQERQQALTDVFRIAEADAIIVNRERSLIAILASEWDIKATETSLLERTPAQLEKRPDWSLMHDLCLLYLVVAHSPDNKLSDPEIHAIIECLNEWQPDLEEDEIRSVMRETLQAYAQVPEAGELHLAIQSIKDAFPIVQRLAVLNDLIYIALIDGDLNKHAASILSTLSQAWELDVQIDGPPQALA